MSVQLTFKMINGGNIMKNTFMKVIYYVFEVTLLLIAIGMIVATIVSDNKDDLVTNGSFLLALSIGTFLFSVLDTLRADQNTKVQDSVSLHLSIGGYIPNKELNELVKLHYLKRHGILTPKMNFVNNWNHTVKLKDFVDRCEFEENVAKHTTRCKVEYAEHQYEAVSASKEMALCIAFLKSCNVNVD